ncbi:hypothetical protein RvY_05167 [Ramazzottius varieornatus]|uniref:AAA+ ATPase domain-containing protein n=1 Tax=Ramazzottius varieornatus TaxID=947166 RepID=A0A1D1UU66_RAMVA|nr:hypothetical protein RvY_05167 [Ramazzottius varieornatus]
MALSTQSQTFGKKQSAKKNRTAKKLHFSDIGGLSGQIRILKKLINISLKETDVWKSMGLQLPRGVMIFGPSGTGKTLLAKTLISESSVFSVSISPLEVLNSSKSNAGGDEMDSHLVRVFAEAKEKTPSIIFIDEIETICPKYETGNMTLQESKAVRTLVNLMDDLGETDAPVVVLATCSKPELLHHSLRRPDRLDTEVEISVPTANDRLDILKVLTYNLKCALTEEDLASISSKLHGFVGLDIKYLCKQAGLIAYDRHKQHPKEVDLSEAVKELSIDESRPPPKYAGPLISIKDFLDAMAYVKPSALREIQIEVPKVRWTDIGGQDDTKLKLKQSVEWPLQHPEAFVRMGIKPPRGILLFGPPGNSKTLIAKALATEAGLNFLAIKGPEIFNKWVGESERTLRDVFNRARKSAPSIIFIDEIDAIASARGSGKGGTSVGDRVLATFLNEMDGIESLQSVIIVAATNRPEIIDKALMRPGRLDRLIYVPLPDSKTRREILNIRFAQTPVAEDVDYEELVTRTEGYSGAEITAVVTEAAMAALQESEVRAERVSMRHLRAGLSSIIPRTTPQMIQSFRDFNENITTESCG